MNEITEFKCGKCGWTTKLTIDENSPEIICPRWKCNAVMKYENGFLIFTGEIKDPFLDIGK